MEDRREIWARRFRFFFSPPSSILRLPASILCALLLAGTGAAQAAEKSGEEKGAVESLVDKNLQALEREPSPASPRKNEVKPVSPLPSPRMTDGQGQAGAGRRATSFVNARDPFLPPSFKETRGKEARELMLKAVFYRDEGGIAIVNDRILRVGDVIEGKRLAAIHRDRVELEDQDGKTTLVLGRFSTAR